MQRRRIEKLFYLPRLLRHRKRYGNQMQLSQSFIIFIFAHPRHASEMPCTLCPACRGRVLRGCASLPLPLTRTAKPLRPLAPHKARPQKTARANVGRACRRKPANLRQKPAKLPLSPLTLSASGFFIAHSVGGSAPLPCLGSGSSAPPSVPRLPRLQVPPRVPSVCPPGAGRRFGCRCACPRSALRWSRLAVPAWGCCLGVLPGGAFFFALFVGRIVFFLIFVCSKSISYVRKLCSSLRLRGLSARIPLLPFRLPRPPRLCRPGRSSPPPLRRVVVPLWRWPFGCLFQF